MHRCQHCGNMFTPKESNRTKYCSRQCAYTPRLGRWGGRANDLGIVKVSPSPAPRHGRARHCRICGQQFIRAVNRSKKAVCAQVCAPACARIDRKQKRQQLSHTPHGRARKAASRAFRKSALGQGETFDPYEVFARDGWSCQRCGRQTPERLRGSHDSAAPELDHVVPLARGGLHTRDNTQTLCRKCNIQKGARAA